MIWHRFVFLLLLPLGLGGCWEQGTRPSTPPTASYGRSEFSASAGDDLPTPSFFRFDHPLSPPE